MSRIHFHSPSGTADIYGTERHYMGRLIDHLAFGVLVQSSPEEWIGPTLPADCYLRGLMPPKVPSLGWLPPFLDQLKVWIAHGDRPHFVLPDGTRADAWQASLNTAMSIGSAPLRLYARLHAQCEIHCFVRGHNRAWLAHVVRQGVRDGLYRDLGGHLHESHKGQWSRLAGFLEARDDEPVVCSYSVCESFPNAGVAEWEPDDEQDDQSWYDLPAEERWDLAFAGLGRRDKLELKPENFDVYRFGPGIDYLQLPGLARLHP